jgi:glutaredoxin
MTATPRVKLSFEMVRLTEHETNMPKRANLPDCLLLSRPGCCLCDEADALLRRHGLVPKQVNIDKSPELLERYTDCVPVVFLDGKKRFTGRVDERLLLRLLGH